MALNDIFNLHPNSFTIDAKIHGGCIAKARLLVSVVVGVDSLPRRKCTSTDGYNEFPKTKLSPTRMICNPETHFFTMKPPDPTDSNVNPLLPGLTTAPLFNTCDEMMPVDRLKAAKLRLTVA